MSEVEALTQLVAEAGRKSDAAHWPEAVAAAVLKDGYRKPREIETTEELDALPTGSVLLTNGEEDSAQKDDIGYWYYWGGDYGLASAELRLPATVLWEPQP